MRNHALSKKLRFASIAEAKFMQFVKPEPGYGQRMGDTITIPRVRNTAEPSSALLDRASKIPIDALALSNRAITVAEYGRGIEYTEETELLATFDPEDMIQKTLKKQMKLTLDTVCSAAFKLCKIRYAPQSLVGGTFTTDGGGTPATATFNVAVAHMKVIRDYLTDTIHCDPYEGDKFLSLASTKALRGLKDDPEFLNWRQYIEPKMAFYKGEVGEIEGIRFVEVNHTNALANNKGTGSVLGEMLVFGDDPVVAAEVKSPELRAAIPGDFGRSRAIAWYGLLAFGEVWDTANDGEARIIYVTSS
jgi:N4-gp56 family major capsid protein